ncbi:FKBP-type peptidyl-prolyl cis-trans isomerase [Sphingomonas sp.]|uniref:FKBP-type peptidyl-prolyl cis-trans isomerase n=1 Tax=Sphingomonas sp. TaxID=28214 RepID=UPI003342BA40
MSITAVPLKPVKRRILVYLWIGIALAVVAAAALAMQTPIDPTTAFLATNARAKGVLTTPSGLQYQVLTPGKGVGPTDEDIALINYEGRLVDGTVFDKSQQPTPIPVVASNPETGRQGVISGFSEALKLMSKGAKYRVWIKPSLGYGEKDQGVIPPHSTLVFDLELLEFIPESTYRQIQQQQQMMQQQQQQRGGGAGLPPGALPPGAEAQPGGR